MRKKTMLRLIVLALAAVLLLAGTALAANEYTITAPNNGHTYAVYQIFTGDYSDGILSNIKWGQNSANRDGANVGDAVPDAVIEELTDTTGSDTDKLAIISSYVNLQSTAVGTITNGNALTVPGGYYLIKDVDNSLEADSNDSYTLYIVEVVNNVTIEPKADVPVFEKKVQDINDSAETTASSWQDSADHDIGDHVSFQLKATLPSRLLDYSVYKVVFTDTLSKGFTYDNNAVVKIDGNVVTENFTITQSTYNEETGTTITFSCNDIMKIDGITLNNSSVITIEYTATLNENAVLGSAGNPNEAKLVYSNNPNYTGEGENSPTGETPKDTVIVFTYETIVNKVTKNPDYDSEAPGSQQYIPLTGAKFTLEKYDKATDTWKPLATVKNDQGTTFTFTGLDDGLYRLTETTTPTGYNTIDPIYFTITAEHATESVNPTLTSLTASQTDESGANLTSGLVATFTPVLSDGSVSTDIVNNQGSTLPETGGMGTTIFYVVGGLLVVGAVVLLITKKRMSQKS